MSMRWLWIVLLASILQGTIFSIKKTEGTSLDWFRGHGESSHAYNTNWKGQEIIPWDFRSHSKFGLKILVVYGGLSKLFHSALKQDVGFVLDHVFAVLDVTTYVHTYEYDFIRNSMKVDRTAKPNELVESFLKRKRHLERYIRKRNFHSVQFVTNIPKPELLQRQLRKVTFRTICSPYSAGLVANPKKKDDAVMEIVHNIACAMGIFKRSFCSAAFHRRNLRCGYDHQHLSDCLRLYVRDNLAVTHSSYDLEYVCKENMAKGILPRQERVSKEKEKSSNLILILSIVGACFLSILGTVVGVVAYRRKKDQKKDKLLRERLTVDLKNDEENEPLTRSVINDSKVTYDLDD